MTSKSRQKRYELQRLRIDAERNSERKERRRTLIKTIAATLLVGLLAVAGLVAAISSGGDESGPNVSPAEISRLLDGIPQKRTILGNREAKVTVVEFGDLQCPVCKQFADEVVRELINGPVRDGKVKLDFLNWERLGPDSSVAARASLAASLQGRYWHFIENFYAEQGPEGTGYVTDDFLRSIAEKAGVPDLEKWEADRFDPRWERELTSNDILAIDLGFEGTPSIAIKGPDNKLVPVGSVPTLEEVETAVLEATR